MADQNISMGRDSSVSREAFTRSATYQQDKVAQRGKDETLPTEHLSPEEKREYNSFLNKTLNHIDSLRYPRSIPDLNNLTTKTMASDDAGSPIEQLIANNTYILTEKGEKKSLNENEKKYISDAVSSFDPEIISLLQREGLTIVLADPGKVPTGGYPGGLKKWLTKRINGKDIPAAAYYNAGSKVVVLSRNSLERDDIIHETTHAIDDLLVTDRKILGDKVKLSTFYSKNDQNLQKIYREYVKRSKQKYNIWNSYAASSEQEYLAVGMEYYLGSSFANEILKRKDPGLYSYIEGFLKRASHHNGV